MIDLSTIAHANTYAAMCKQKKEHALQTEPCAELTDLRQRLLFYQERVFASPGAEEALALASVRECAAEGRCTDTSTLRRADDVPRSPPNPDANAQRYAIVRD